MDSYDVAVIGCGPAGSMAAKYAAKAGSSVAILEEHASIGWPVECAGLLGLKAIAESELPPGKYLLREFRGATVYSPGGCRVDFKASSARAWAVDRRLFDRALAIKALNAGAELRLCSPVNSITRDEKSRSSLLTLSGSDTKIRAKTVISAEGVRALLSRLAGIPPAKKVLSGAQVEAPFEVEDPEKAEVHLGVPGLFAWVVPLGNNRARIGLCADRNGCERLQSFLRKDVIKRRLLGSPAALVVGGLPLGPVASAVSDGFMAVGDAAGQVKPTSGGGIYPGLVCAKIAGEVAAAAVQEGDCSAKRLTEYERRWRAILAKELEIGMKANRFLNRMSHEEMDELVGFLSRKPEILRSIEEQGDIDRPSVLMLKMLPRLGLDAIGLAKFLRYCLG